METKMKESVTKCLDSLPSNVLLVAAAKSRTPEEVKGVIKAGVKIIGYNYVQEAEQMIQHIGSTVQWHLIGHLQRNKAKKAVRLFDMIETIDSWRIAETVDRSTLKGKELLIKRTMAVCAAIDCLGICKIPALSLIMDFDLKKEAVLTKGITGAAFGNEDLLRIGERVLQLERLINLKLGASSKDDELPKMFQEVSVPSGPNKGLKIENFSDSVRKFYRVMGWNTEGVPIKETLEKLGIGWVWEDLSRL